MEASNESKVTMYFFLFLVFEGADNCHTCAPFLSIDQNFKVSSSHLAYITQMSKFHCPRPQSGRESLKCLKEGPMHLCSKEEEGGAACGCSQNGWLGGAVMQAYQG